MSSVLIGNSNVKMVIGNFDSNKEAKIAYDMFKSCIDYGLSMKEFEQLTLKERNVWASVALAVVRGISGLELNKI